MGNPGGHDDTARRDGLATGQLHREAGTASVYGGHHFLLKRRNQLLLERQPVLAKRLQRHRQTHIGVGQPLFPAILTEREPAFGMIDARSESVRLQKHAGVHLGEPALHRLAEYAKRHAELQQVRCDGQSIRAGAYDRYVRCLKHGHCPAICNEPHQVDERLRRCSPPWSEPAAPSSEVSISPGTPKPPSASTRHDPVILAQSTVAMTNVRFIPALVTRRGNKEAPDGSLAIWRRLQASWRYPTATLAYRC